MNIWIATALIIAQWYIGYAWFKEVGFFDE